MAGASALCTLTARAKFLQFCERVQLDAIVDNELGDPDAIATTTSSEPSVLTNWRDTPRCAHAPLGWRQ